MFYSPSLYFVLRNNMNVSKQNTSAVACTLLIQCFLQMCRAGEIMEGSRDDARLLRRLNTLYLNENSCARIALRPASSCQDFTFLCYFFSSFFSVSPG